MEQKIRLGAVASALKRAALWGALCLVLILIAIAYSNTFQSPPVLDDFHSFVRNQKIFVNEWSVETVEGLSKGFFGISRWIPMLTFALDYYLGGGLFIQFHITNLIIHLLSFLAVFFLVLQCGRAGWKDESFSRPPYVALWVAAIWALNPVQTSAVTYMVQRMASIQALFYILSVGCYLQGRMRQFNDGRVRFALPSYAGCCVAGLAAFLSKENSATLPFMIGLAELWFFQPSGIHRLWNWFRSASKSVWLLTTICGVVLFAIVYTYFDNFLTGYGIRHFTMMERLLTQSRIVVWYMSLLLWPTPGRLSLEHDVALSTSLFHPFTTIFAIFFHAALAWFIIKKRRDFPLITFGLLWFYVNLAIESTIVPLELVFEHRLYLPSVGFIVAAVFAALRIFGSVANKLIIQDKSRLSWSAVAIVCSALTLLTFYRNQAWQDIVTINQDAAKKAPNHPRAYANLATALLRAEKYDEAIAAAEKAIELGRPHLEDYVVAANNIVGVYTQQGLWREAAVRGEVFILERPQGSDLGALPNLYLRVAHSYWCLGKLDKAYRYTKNALIILKKQPLAPRSLTLFAIGELQAILHRAQSQPQDLDGDGLNDPGDVLIGTWIARVLVECKAYAETVDLLQKTSREHLQNQDTEDFLASLIKEIESNRRQQARWSFDQKYVQKPFSMFNICMAVAYLVRKNKLSEPFARMGEFCLSKAQELNPRNPDTYLLRGWYEYEKGLFGQAAKHAERAIQLDSEYAKAWLGLGFFLTEAGDRIKAVAAFQRTLKLYPGYPQKRTILDLIAKLELPAGAEPSKSLRSLSSVPFTDSLAMSHDEVRGWK